MTRSIRINNRLEDRQTTPEGSIAPFIRSLVQRRTTTKLGDKPLLYWQASYFGLHRLPLFLELGDEAQSRVLRSLNQTMLEEAFYIEKSGMTYTSKMSLMAESNDEQSLYAMLASDEAVHFQMISQFLLETPRPYEQQPFLVLLNELVELGSFSALIFIAQVLLEGWGLSHYMSLLKNSQCPQLSQLLRMILNDEAVHHGSGLVMTQKHPLEGPSLSMVQDVLVRFFGMVAAGPMRVAGALAVELGDMGCRDFEQMYSDMGAQEQIQGNLDALSKLIFEHGSQAGLHDFIWAQGLDSPVNAQNFAKAMMSEI